MINFYAVRLEAYVGIVCDCPLKQKGGMCMNTLEVLTLVLVIFAALSYIDNHKK